MAPVASFLTAGPTSVIGIDLAMRHWNFGMQLAQHMYEEGLLDRHEFLTWLVELLEKTKVTDDNVLKLIIAQVLRVCNLFLFHEIKEKYQLNVILCYGT